MTKGRLIRLIAIFIVVIACAMAARLLPVRDQLAAALEWVGGLGMLGLVVLALCYIPTALLLMPAWVLSMALGYFYGPYYGFLAALTGSTSGAAVAFLFGRTLGRRWVEARFGRHPRFQALDRGVGRDGFKIVLMTRLSPLLPYVLMNYAFSLTRVSFRTFVLATLIGIGPVTLLYVYVGSTLHQLSDLLESKQSLNWPLLLLGIGSTIVLAVVLTRMTRRALAEAFTEDGSLP